MGHPGVWLFWAEEGVELGVGCEDVFCHGAQDIDAEVMVLGVLESRGDQFEGEAAAAELLGDFGVPEGQPALAVGFEFEIAGLAFVLDLEAAAGDLGWVVHSDRNPSGRIGIFRSCLALNCFPSSGRICSILRRWRKPVKSE